MAIPSSLIKEIKRKTDIVSLIGETVQLEQRGNVYIGCCPFPHGGSVDSPVYETTPSLVVYPDSQSYYCYGCGRGEKGRSSTGSDCISWVRDLKNLNFSEAVEYLAKRAGIDLPLPEPVKHNQEIQKALEEPTERNVLFCRTLIANNAALEYLQKRGITMESIKEFRLGLVPNDRKYHAAGRLAFPVLDMNNKYTLGFGYRAMDNSQPKYT